MSQWERAEGRSSDAGKWLLAALAALAAVWWATGAIGLSAPALMRAGSAALWLAAMILMAAAARGASVKLGGGFWWAAASAVAGCILLSGWGDPMIAAAVGAIVPAVIAAVCPAGAGVMRPVAYGFIALAAYHAAYQWIPCFASAVEACAAAQSRALAASFGRPVDLGPTFSGFEPLVTVLCLAAVAVRAASPRSRLRTAVLAALCIAAAQALFLLVMAYADGLIAWLPPRTAPPETEINFIGQWTWGNALHALLPWNLPAVAVVLHGCAAAVILVVARGEGEQQPTEPAPSSSVRRGAGQFDELFRFGPAVLAALALLAMMLGSRAVSLADKRVVAYEFGYLHWSKPVPARRDPPARSYGMLATLIEMLGGKFTRTESLSDEELKSCDVLLVIHPDRPWAEETLDRIEQFVGRGGGLVVAAEPMVVEGERRSSDNELLERFGLEVRRATAVPAADGWEHSLRALGEPASAVPPGRGNRFGLVAPAPIRAPWPAHCVLSGRYGWAVPGSEAAATGRGKYAAGRRLGDLCLAAERRFGQGRVIVLGDAAALTNDALPGSWEYVSRLLARAAATEQGDHHAPWRQGLALAALALLVGLLLARPEAVAIGSAGAAIAVAGIVLSLLVRYGSTPVPDGNSASPPALAYIDLSHANAVSDAPGERFSMTQFQRALMIAGMLPLGLDRITPERLEKAQLLVSPGPQRGFSSDEIAAIEAFVSGGGIFVCTIGAEEVRPMLPTLEQWGFHITPSPQPPGRAPAEPWPLSAFRQIYRDERPNDYVQFYAGWPLDLAQGADPLVLWVGPRGEERPVVGQRVIGRGLMIVVADTYFAADDNMRPNDRGIVENDAFWQWLVGLTGRKPADQPPAEPVESGAPIEPEDVKQP